MNSRYYVNAKVASPSKFIKIAILSHLKIVHALKRARSHHRKAPQRSSPQVTGCGLWPTNHSEVLLAPRLWFLRQAPFSDLDLSEMCTRAKTNKRQVFELWAEPGVASADGFSNEREGHTVNVGLTLGWNAVEHRPAERQWGRLDRIEQPWTVTSIFHCECGLWSSFGYGG